jgi:hypothetical protein
VFNRGECSQHDPDWEEPLLKRIRHLQEMTMKAEAARAGKRLKHAVAALSVVGTFAGRRDLYRRLASMTDVQLLAALAADNFELILEGSSFPPGTNGSAPGQQQTLDTEQRYGEGGKENARTLKPGPPPQLPSTSQRRAHDQQQQASPAVSARNSPAWTSKQKRTSNAAATSPARIIDEWEEDKDDQD